jgi:redox-sensitive bicupin YhaK (pirin superfamily)
MSGPVEPKDEACANEPVPDIEVREGRHTEVGGIGISRVLPTKGRRTIGAWCFVDLMTPDDLDEPMPLEIGPHPHIGLQTVTWLFAGAALHGDSLGTEQLIRPGQLNLMTSGRGIAHAEDGRARERIGAPVGGIAGAQLWIALPEGTRHGESRFQHLEELPTADLPNGDASVMIGRYAEAESGAVVDTPLIGLDARFDGSTVIATDPTFEYGVVPLDRTLKVHDVVVEPGSLALVPTGQFELPVEVDGGRARMLVLGGEPLGEPIQMWWNFVARTKDEIADAWQAWQRHDIDRFAPVPSDLPRIDAPRPPWVPAGG